MKILRVLPLAGFLPAMALAGLAPEPTTLHPGGFDVTPTLSAGLVSDDNFYTEPSTSEDGTLVLTVAPAVQVRRGVDEEYVELLAGITSGTVTEDGDDSFLDYNFGLSAQMMPAGNLALSARLGFDQGHDTRGSGRTEGCITNTPPVAPAVACQAEPDVFQEGSARVSATLGNKDSRGRATLGFDQRARRYVNNGLNTGPLEYDLGGLDLKFAWRVGGRTDAVLEFSNQDYDYITGGATADSTSTEYLLGVEWDVTGVITGYAKAGVTEKDFDNAARKDLDNTAWRLGADWSPTEQDMVNVQLDSRIEESSVAQVVGLVVTPATAEEVSTFSLRYSHMLNDRLEPYARFWQQSTDYQGITRSDDLTSLGVGVDYKFRRWAVLGASLGTLEQASDAGPAFEYESTVFALTARLTL